MLYELLRRFPGECGLPADVRLQATLDFLGSNQDAQRLTSVMQGAVAQFHIDKATSPAGIFYQVCPGHALSMHTMLQRLPSLQKIIDNRRAFGSCMCSTSVKVPSTFRNALG